MATRPRLTPARTAFAALFVVTGLNLLAIGVTLPVLPRYVSGPIAGTDFDVGIVGGAFAITGLAARPIAGRLADRHGRRIVVICGCCFATLAGLLYFVPAGVPGLLVARLVLGAGEGVVYTASAAWVVDMTPPERRGRIIGIFGLAIWSGLALGPPLGELILHATDYEGVWAFAAAAPLLGIAIAMRIPESFAPHPALSENRSWIAREALRPGLGLGLSIVGYAAMAAFVVLHLDQEGVGHGAAVFAAFAASVVAMRVLGGWLPDRYGSVPCVIGAGISEAIGLLVIAEAESIPVAVLGAVLMGAGFSLLFPSLALLFVNRVTEDRRGIAMGTFTAFFDLGMGVGSVLAGIAASLGGYEAAFALGSVCAVATIAVALSVTTASESPDEQVRMDPGGAGIDRTAPGERLG